MIQKLEQPYNHPIVITSYISNLTVRTIFFGTHIKDKKNVHIELQIYTPNLHIIILGFRQ